MKRITLLLAASLLSLYAQSSSLQGVVTDQQGAAITEAVVSITNTDTSAARKVIVNATGTYSFLQVPPGTYKVEIQHPGFRTYNSNVRLAINVPSTLDVKLELGQVSEVVNVSEEMSQINTQNATIGNAFSQVQVRQLPLQTRNVVELLSIQPGVTSTGEVLGAKRDQNNVTLDGVDVNDNQNAGMANTGSAGLNAALPVCHDVLTHRA